MPSLFNVTCKNKVYNFKHIRFNQSKTNYIFLYIIFTSILQNCMCRFVYFNSAETYMQIENPSQDRPCSCCSQ